MPAVISVENVSKRFVLHHHRARSFQDALVNLVHQRNGTAEEFWALRDVSFEVNHGETLGIIGENGSGKSTILKLVTNILKPTSGKVSVTGRISALIEVGAGFHPDLTGRENIYLNGAILGLDRKEMDRRFDEIVAFSELERFIDTPVKHYSSGMYVRLGFSVATSVEPDVLIIDEVLAVGDEVFQRKCLDRITDFRRRGKTIIFVSHGLTAVEFLCDRVVWIHHGVVQRQGAAVPVIRSYMAEMQRHDEEIREIENHAAAEHETRAAAPVLQDARSGEIQDVQLLSGDYRETYTYRTGEKMIARLAIRPRDPRGTYAVGVELRRNDGLLVFKSSRKCRGPWPVGFDGIPYLDVEFEALPLLAGTYDITPSFQAIDSAALPANP
ncbi:MAG: polysaccharide ABC transporter ATP-binding protein, partial [Chloroflexota bacterium]